jgi:hypothetical protein
MLLQKINKSGKHTLTCGLTCLAHGESYNFISQLSNSQQRKTTYFGIFKELRDWLEFGGHTGHVPNRTVAVSGVGDDQLGE